MRFGLKLLSGQINWSQTPIAQVDDFLREKGTFEITAATAIKKRIGVLN